MQVTDKIEIPNLTKVGISPKVRELYEKGASLCEIAKELQITRHMARKVLLTHNLGLRSSNRRLKDRYCRTVGRYLGAAPFGYFIKHGKLVEDGREQEVIRLIMDLRSKGKSFSGIAKYLNGHKIRTRKSKRWDHSTVGNIIRYHLERT